MPICNHNMGPDSAFSTHTPTALLKKLVIPISEAGKVIWTEAVMA